MAHKEVTDRSIFSDAYDNDEVVIQRRTGFFYHLDISPSMVQLGSCRVFKLDKGLVRVTFHKEMVPTEKQWDLDAEPVWCYHAAKAPHGLPHRAVTAKRVDVTWAEVKA